MNESLTYEPIGSSRKKFKCDCEDILLESSDDEACFKTMESEGYRLIDLKNLSSAVSNAHVCDEGVKNENSWQ